MSLPHPEADAVQSCCGISHLPHNNILSEIIGQILLKLALSTLQENTQKENGKYHWSYSITSFLMSRALLF